MIYQKIAYLALLLLSINGSSQGQIKVRAEAGLSAMSLGMEGGNFRQSFYYFPERKIRSLGPVFGIGIAKSLGNATSLTVDLNYARYRFEVVSNNGVPVTYGQFSTLRLRSSLLLEIFPNTQIGFGPATDVLFDHKQGNDDGFQSDPLVGYTNFQFSLVTSLAYTHERIVLTFHFSKGIAYRDTQLYDRYIPQVNFSNVTVSCALIYPGL